MPPFLGKGEMCQKGEKEGKGTASCQHHLVNLKVLEKQQHGIM